MIKKHSLYILACVLLVVHVPVSAQELFSCEDSARINNKAIALIKNLGERLNNFISPENEANDIEIYKKNLLSGPKQIFNNDSVIIDNDLNPTLLSITEPKIVSDYIAYLQVNYSQNEEHTIAYKDIRPSVLKKTSYIYLNVYFTADLKGTFKSGNEKYPLMKRVAEVIIKKGDDKKWRPYVNSISFAKTEDITADTANAIREFTGYEDYISKKSTGVTFSDAREIEQRNEKISTTLSQGERAFSNKEYYIAAAKFNEVLQYDPDNKRALRQLKKTDDLLEMEALAKAKALELETSANKFFKKRQYDEAKKALNALFKIVPEKETDPAIFQKLQIINDILPDIQSYAPQFETKNYDVVINACKERIDESKSRNNGKDYPEFYLWRAKSMLAKNAKKYEEDAKKDLDKALEKATDYNDALEARAYYYAVLAQKKSPINADKDLSRLILNNPENAHYLRQRAIVRDSITNYSGAVDDYRQAVALDPGKWNFYFEKAVIECKLKQYDSALVSLNHAIDLENDKEAFLLRGIVYEKLDKISKASLDFRQAIKLGISDAKVREIRELALGYFNKGFGFYKIGNYRAAIPHFDSAIKIYSWDSASYYYNALSYMNLNILDSALANFSKAIDLNNNNSDYFYNRGVCKYRQQEYEQAGSDFSAAVKINTTLKTPAKNYNVMLYKANVSFQTADYAAAIADFKKALDIKSDSAEIFNVLGVACYRIKNYGLAISSYSSAIKKNEKYTEAWFNRGIANYEAKKWKDATADFTEVCKLDPKSKDAWNLKGKALWELEKYDEAQMTFTHLSELDPTVADTWFIIGKCFYKLGRYDESLSALKSAKKNDEHLDNNQEFNQYFGYVNFQKGFKEQAGISYNKILKNDPHNGAALFYLACLSVTEGKKEEALQGFEEAFKTKTITSDMIKKEPALKEFRKTDEFGKLMNKYF